MERRVLWAWVVCVAVAGGAAAADSGPSHVEPKAVAAVCGIGSATVTWSAVNGSGVVGYNVFERISGAGAYAQANAGPVTSTAYPVAGLQPATAYDFGVTAVYLDGASSAMAGPATCATA